MFKDVYKNIVGEENATKYKRIGWSIASGSAEVIADVLLCPWEACKVRMQTSKAKNVDYPRSFFPAFSKILSEDGVKGLYKGIGPLWGR